jgi:hypothetical protein
MVGGESKQKKSFAPLDKLATKAQKGTEDRRGQGATHVCKLQRILNNTKL